MARLHGYRRAAANQRPLPRENHDNRMSLQSTARNPLFNPVAFSRARRSAPEDGRILFHS